MHTDCRGGELVHLMSLLEAATRPDGGQPRAGAEAPAAALANAVKNALGSSYLRKLQELADNDSGSGGASRAEGLLVLFSTQLGAAFVGTAVDGSAGGTETQAQQLLGAALPAALWQRCGSGLRVCWAPAGGGKAAPPPLLPVLQAAMQQRCKGAAALDLAELAGPCSLAQFAARLALPAAAGEVAQPGGEAEEDEACWPAAAGPEESALDNLKLLLAQLEGHQGELQGARRSRHGQAGQRGTLPGRAARRAACFLQSSAALVAISPLVIGLPACPPHLDARLPACRARGGGGAAAAALGAPPAGQAAPAGHDAGRAAAQERAHPNRQQGACPAAERAAPRGRQGGWRTGLLVGAAAFKPSSPWFAACAAAPASSLPGLPTTCSPPSLAHWRPPVLHRAARASPPSPTPRVAPPRERRGHSQTTSSRYWHPPSALLRFAGSQLPACISASA